MTLTEKVAYLKGLMDGLELDDSSKESKLIKAIVDVLDDMALTVSDLEDEVADLDEQVELIDEDLDTLEEDYYSLFDDEDEEDEDDECDCCEDDELYEVKCPNCGDLIYLDGEMLDEGSIACPNCKELLEFEVGCDCDDDDCDCGHPHED